jgi:chromosome segregation ATPase
MMATTRRSTPTEAIAARKSAATDKVNKVRLAIRRIAKRGSPLTKANIADTAGVSRTFLYENPEARALVEEALRLSDADATVRDQAVDEADAASWRARALNAEDGLRQSRSKIEALQQTVADLLGQLRDPDGTSIIDERQQLRDQIISLTRELEDSRRQLAEANRRLDAVRRNRKNDLDRLATHLYPVDDSTQDPDHAPGNRQEKNE